MCVGGIFCSSSEKAFFDLMDLTLELFFPWNSALDSSSEYSSICTWPGFLTLYLFCFLFFLHCSSHDCMSLQGPQGPQGPVGFPGPKGPPVSSYIFGQFGKNLWNLQLWVISESCCSVAFQWEIILVYNKTCNVRIWLSFDAVTHYCSDYCSECY